MVRELRVFMQVLVDAGEGWLLGRDDGREILGEGARNGQQQSGAEKWAEAEHGGSVAATVRPGVAKGI